MASRHTFTLLPFLRNNRLNNDGDSAVYLRITIDGKRIEISTKIYVHKDKWNSSKGMQKGNSEEARIINGSIKSYEMRARAIYSQLIEATTCMSPIRSPELSPDEYFA